MWISTSASISFVDNSPQLSTAVCTLEQTVSTKQRGRSAEIRKVVTQEKMLNRNKMLYKQHKTLEDPQQKGLHSISTNPQRLMQPLLNMYMSFLKESTSGKLKCLRKLLLVVLFFVSPWNLGKHFEGSPSFVGTDLLPYLIPTLYLQDLVVVTFLLVSLLCKRGSSIDKRSTALPVRLFFLFLFSCLLSLPFTSRLAPSLYFFTRLLLYFLFFVISADSFSDKFVRRAFFVSVVVNMVLLSFLGFVQFNKQSSVFSNYLFFGEQPYNIYTPLIAKESFGGVAKIPPYGTFGHPNVFAGFLVISLTFVIGRFLKQPPKHARLWVGVVLIVLLGFYILFLTKSYSAWVALLLGFLLVVRLRPLVYVLIGTVIVLLGLFLPLFKERLLVVLPANSTQSVLSVERRANLLTASYRMFLQKPFFGWGLNSFTYNFDPFYTRTGVAKFFQPVHNVYALIASEVGVFGVAFFVSLTLFVIYYSARYGNPLYSVVLIQTIFLSSFDHYFFTIHQTQLLFMLTLLLALTYTKNADCL